MIQRSQSVYLLLATVLMSFMLIRPYAALEMDEDQWFSFRVHAVVSMETEQSPAIYKATFPVAILVVITALISFGNIFLYNSRIMQIRVCLVNTVLLVVLLIIMLGYYISIKNTLSFTHHSFKISAIFPVLSIIFNLMAARAIHHDELLVNSYKRIR